MTELEFGVPSNVGFVKFRELHGGSYVSQSQFIRQKQSYLKSVSVEFFNFVMMSGGFLKSVDEMYKLFLEQKNCAKAETEPFLNDFSESEPDGFAPIIMGFQRVGHGKKTNDKCGKFMGYKACLHTGLHHLSLDGSIHEGDVFTKKKHHHCFNWRCPVCYRYSSSVREADRIEQRINQGSKRFGAKPEHGVVSFSEADRVLSVEKLLAKAVKGLYARGITGGSLILHLERYRSSEYVRGGVRRMAEWYFSPHVHFLGFFKNEYGRCRNCKYFDEWGSKSTKGHTRHTNHGGSACLGCSGFEGLTRRLYEKDGLIVKVMAERKSIFGTAYYELNHASVKVDKARYQIVHWFGNCSKRKLKVVFEDHKQVCPSCSHELVDARYFGSMEFITSLDSRFYERDVWLPLKEDNCIVWVEKAKGNSG